MNSLFQCFSNFFGTLFIPEYYLGWPCANDGIPFSNRVSFNPETYYYDVQLTSSDKSRFAFVENINGSSLLLNKREVL